MKGRENNILHFEIQNIFWTLSTPSFKKEFGNRYYRFVLALKEFPSSLNLRYLSDVYCWTNNEFFCLNVS
jgi:hypothetical protein